MAKDGLSYKCEVSMSGVLDWLDSGVSKIGSIAGKAVDAAGSIVTKAQELSNKAATAGARPIDQTLVPATSPVQTQNSSLGNIPAPVLYAGGILLVAGLAYLIYKAAK